MNPIQKQLLVYGAVAMLAMVSEGVVHSSPIASGTGFFITDDGYLISNYHVVKDATQVRVVTSSATLPAKVVQVDAANDLALLKAEGNFSPLPITASRTVSLGATVATIGFPDIGLQGFAPKLAKGEIAALSGIQDDPRYFQISAPVQPGNSGGALVDGQASARAGSGVCSLRDFLCAHVRVSKYQHVTAVQDASRLLSAQNFR